MIKSEDTTIKKALLIKNFLRKYIFKKTEIVRNTVWISVTEQCNNLAWDGTSIATIIDSIFNVIIRLMVIFLTILFVPIGALSLFEQVTMNIIVEIWENISQKQGISVVASYMTIFVSGLFWFLFFVICVPFTIISMIFKQISVKKAEGSNSFRWAITGTLFIFIALFSIFLVAPYWYIAVEFPPLLLAFGFLISILLLFGLQSLLKRNKNVGVWLLFAFIFLLIIIFVVYPNWDFFQDWILRLRSKIDI